MFGLRDIAIMVVGVILGSLVVIITNPIASMFTFAIYLLWIIALNIWLLR